MQMIRHSNLTFSNKCMHRSQLRMLCVLFSVVDQILQQKQVSGTSLDYGKEPISEFQFAAPRVGLLSREEIREFGVIMQIRPVRSRKRHQLGECFDCRRERSYERSVQGEIRKMSEK
jgi:hypothetical protein